jgi:hypothetical protein|tara:strand:+ start:244 stop:1458 length:1215 start_codon:yes stop_codon:yes gene_type:complete
MSDRLTHDIPRLEKALLRLNHASSALANALSQQHNWAYWWYQHEGDEPVEVTDWDIATKAIIERVTQQDYQDLSPKRVQVGAIAVSRETLALAEALNRAKQEFDALRQSIRAELAELHGEDDSRYAAKHIRTGLQRLGAGRLNLSAVSRKIPILTGTALRLRWHYYNAPPIARRAVADVVQELRDLLSEQRFSSDEEAGLIQSEIQRLSTIDQTLPVACRLRQSGSTATRFSAAYTEGQVKRYVRSRYASNPVFFLNTPGIHPTVTPFERDTIDEREDRKRISDDRVTRVFRLSNYFWYLQPKAKKPVPKPEKSKNPYASTGFPGLSFWARSTASGLTPQIRVLKADKRVTQISIEKHGYERAWREAAVLYAEGRDNISAQAVIDNRPPSQQYHEMLAWALTKQ